MRPAGPSRESALLAVVPLLLAALLAVAPGPVASGAPPAATFVGPAGAPLPVRAAEAEGKTLLSVGDVVAALGGTVEHDAESGSYEAKAGAHTAVFGAETNVAVVDTRLVPYGAPIRGEGGDAYAEPDFFERVVAPLFGVAFSWDRGSRTLSARLAQPAEIGVEATVAAFDETTKVVFRFTQPPMYRLEKGETQVVLRVVGSRLVFPAAEKPVDDPRVARILLRPTEMTVVLRSKGLSSNVYALNNPPRLVVDVTRPAAPLPVVPQPVPGALSAPLPTRPPEPKTVVLDAGHGGSEEGAKGPAGTLEKDATLAIARTVRDVLVKRGYRVVLTRDSDVSVGLEDRAALANAAKADVFVSIHLNASLAEKAHGTEVYYLSLDASDRAAAALAEAENRTGAEPTPTPSAEANAARRELDLILWDLAQNQHLAASSRLADIIQGDFNRLLGITTRGVKQAPFKVLIGVNAPAVLVEVAFVTNPDEEARLDSDEFRKQVADTLAGSLDTFFKTAEGVSPVPYVAPANGRR